MRFNVWLFSDCLDSLTNEGIFFFTRPVMKIAILFIHHQTIFMFFWSVVIIFPILIFHGVPSWIPHPISLLSDVIYAQPKVAIYVLFDEQRSCVGFVRFNFYQVSTQDDAVFPCILPIFDFGKNQIFLNWKQLSSMVLLYSIKVSLFDLNLNVRGRGGL